MEGRTGEDLAKAGPASRASASKPDRGSLRRAFGVKGLVVLVACSAAVFYAVRAVREGMRPSLAWVRQVRSGDVDDRRIAARQLGDSSPEDIPLAIPTLIAALGDPDEAVRADVASSLGVAGLGAMKDKALKSESREAATALTRALADDGAEVRRAAVSALGDFSTSVKTAEFPADPASTATALAGLLADPSAMVRKQAVKALSQVGAAIPIEPPDALLKGLEGWPLADSRASAAFSLGSFRARTKASVLALAAALKDREPEVRTNAAVALAKLGADAAPALPSLAETVKDPFVPPPLPDIPRVVASVASGQANAPADITTDPAVEAINAIGRIVEGQAAKGEAPSAEAVNAVVRALQASRPEIKAAAAQALQRIGRGGSAAIPALIKNLGEAASTAGPGFGPAVALALGAIAPNTESAPQAISALIEALDARDLETRISAAGALAKFGPAASGALPRLRELGGDAEQQLAAASKTAADRIEGKAPPEAPRRKGRRAGGPRP